MSSINPLYKLVESDRELERVAAELEQENVLGVDLEADSMFHFKEKVCLLQVSSRSQNFLIDPIAIKDLSALSRVFSDPKTRKIFHGADYDIRCLHRDFEFEVHSLFDTQIAARFLGLNELGLAGLLKDKFGLVIEKKYQKKDWSKRPLPPEMLSYAVQDACHLIPLSELLEEELKEKGRLFCVKEECDILSEVRSAPCDGEPLFLKFKGAARLDRNSLAVLESILQFRRAVARRKDRPEFKVMGKGLVQEIVEKKPVTEDDLSSLKGLSQKMQRELGPSIVRKTREALALPEEALPAYPRRKAPPVRRGASRRIRALKDLRERFATELGVEPSLVLTTAQIHLLADQRPRSCGELEGVDGLRNWQIRLLGKEICALVA